MASNKLPINIQMGSLPPRVRWTPQQLADAIAVRLSLTTAQSFSLFVSGSTAPTFNAGPWAKNGNEWYFWSDTAGAYVPQFLSSAALGYIISSAAPDPNLYNFWIQTQVDGTPIGINIYTSGAWVDIYGGTVGAFLTISSFNSTIANYSTTAAMNAAIAAAVGGIPSSAKYPFRAYKLAAVQSYTAGSGITQVVLDGEAYDTQSVFAANSFTAPVAGVYQFSAKVNIGLTSGTPTNIIRNIYLRLGGATLLAVDKAQNTDLTAGIQLQINTMLQLAMGAVVDLAVEITSTGASTWMLVNNQTDCNFSGALVST